MNQCFWCGKDCEEKDITKDHIVAKQLRCQLNDNPGKIVKCCTKCNNHRGRISAAFIEIKSYEIEFNTKRRVIKLLFQRVDVVNFRQLILDKTTGIHQDIALKEIDVVIEWRNHLEKYYG